MALVLKDRVQETTTTTGTGTLTLGGAVTGYQSFSAIGNSNTTYYAIYGTGSTEWEVGIGTYTASGTTLSRDTVLASSNSGSLVNFSAGSKNVWCDYPAGKAVYTDASGSISEAIVNISGISGAITTPDSITFDITPETVPTAPGSLYWDSADGNQTLSLVMANGDAIQQIGEETYFRIKASAPITEGQVVMFTGTVGASGGLTGAPASGLTASTASYVMGIATHTLATNDWGYITAFGLVRGINTSAFANGDILYYDPTVAGGLTTSIPAAPNAKVQVCAVVYAASNGSLFVRPSFGGILGQYEGDVQVTSPANGDLIIRNQTSGKWVNAPLTAGTGISVTNTAGAITIANTAPSSGGTVTSVSGTGTVNGITLTGTVTSSGDLTLGGTLGGIANSQLTNSSITINGTAVSLGGSTTVSASAAGSTTQVQYNNSGAFAGDADFTYNATDNELKAGNINATNGLLVNSTTVNSSYTVASGSNAFSVGPITTASGVTVTVSSGQRWVVI